MVRLCHLRLFLLFSLTGVALGHGGFKGKGAKLESKKPCNKHKISVDFLESDDDFDFLNQLLPVFNFGFGRGAFNKGRRGGCTCQLTTPSPREVCPNNVTMNVTNGQHGWWRGMEMRRYRPNKKSISLKDGCPVRVPLPSCPDNPEKLKDKRTRRSPHRGGSFRKGNYFRMGNNDGGSSSEESNQRSWTSRGKMFQKPRPNQRRCIDQKSKETKFYYIQDVSTVFMTATVTSNVYVTNSRDIENVEYEDSEESSVQFSINTSPVESSTGVVSGIAPTRSTQYTFTETAGGFSNGQQDDWAFGRKRWTSMDSGTYSSEAWSSSRGQGELSSSSVFNQVSRDSSGTRGSDSKSSSSGSTTNSNQGSSKAWSSTRGLDELSASSSSVNQNGRETSRSRESDAVLGSKTTYQVSSSWSSTYLVGGAQDSATRAPFSTAISSAFSSSTRKESDYSTQIQQSSQSRGNNNDRENYGRIPGGESQIVEETEETMPTTTTSSYARKGRTRTTVTSSTTNIESSFSQASSTKSSSADRTDTSRVVTSSTQSSSSSSSISSSDSLSPPTISSISSPSSPTTSSTAFTSAATTSSIISTSPSTTSSIASTSPPATFSVASSSSPTTSSFVSKSSPTTSPIDTTSSSTSTITTQNSKSATNRETDTTQTSTISSRSSYYGLMDILEKEKISSTSKTSPSAQTTASISDAPPEITSRSRWEVQTTSEKKTSKETIAVTESPKLKIEITPKISPFEPETRPVVFSTEKATRDSTTAEIKSVARPLTTRATDNDNNESVKRESTALKVETARTESTRAISAAETTQKSITSEPEITRALRTTPVPISQSEATRRSRWDLQASTQQETTTSYSREDAEKRKSTIEQSRGKNENSSSSGSSNNNLEALVNGGRKIEPTESTGRDSKESERKEIALQGNNTTFDNKQQTVIQKSGAKNTSTGDDVADAAHENRKYVYYLLFGNSNCMCNEKNNKTGLNQTEPEQTDAQGVSWKQQGFPNGDGGQFYIGYKGKNGTQERVRSSIVEVKVSHADFNCTSMFAPLFGN